MVISKVINRQFDCFCPHCVNKWRGSWALIEKCSVCAESYLSWVSRGAAGGLKRHWELHAWTKWVIKNPLPGGGITYLGQTQHRISDHKISQIKLLRTCFWGRGPADTSQGQIIIQIHFDISTVDQVFTHPPKQRHAMKEKLAKDGGGGSNCWGRNDRLHPCLFGATRRQRVYS